MQIRKELSGHFRRAVYIVTLLHNTIVVCSQHEVVMLGIEGEVFKEICRMNNPGRTLGVYPAPDRNHFFILSEFAPEELCLQLVEDHHLLAPRRSVPFSRLHQVSSTDCGNIVAICGPRPTPGRIGYFEPIESAIVDMRSGTVHRLPFPAVALTNNRLLFQSGTQLYRSAPLSVDSLAETTEQIKTLASCETMTSDLMFDSVGIFPGNNQVTAVSPSGITRVVDSFFTVFYKCDTEIDTVVLDDLCITKGISERVRIIDLAGEKTYFVQSTDGEIISWFDIARQPAAGGDRCYRLATMSERGCVDVFTLS